MRIEKIKEEISNMISKKVLIKANIGRNKYEYIEGVILDVYPYLFTIKTDNEIKSFSYSDVLTKNIIFKIN